MDEKLLTLLQNGGYILYFRHGEATVGEDDKNLNFEQCSTQRNLSKIGRRQAIYVGEMLRYLHIPICNPVIVSPFCRTVESARLAFALLELQVDPIGYGIYRLGKNVSTEEMKNILAALNNKLEIPPPAGCNQVIVAHSFPKGLGLGEIPNMGMVIIKPLGPGKGYEILDRISIEDFTHLAL